MVGVQGPGFLKNSKGLRVWKLTYLSLLLLGQFLLPSQLKCHLLWEAPKDSSDHRTYFHVFNFYLPFCLPYT